MVRIWEWHDAPERLREKAKAHGLWSGGDEDYLLLGTKEDEPLIGTLIDRLAICDGDYKEIDGEVIGYTCHA